MSTLSDVSIKWGRGNSRMSREERSRAEAFWQARLARQERKDRMYRRDDDRLG